MPGLVGSGLVAFSNGISKTQITGIDNARVETGLVSRSFWSLDGDIGDQGDRICHEDTERKFAGSETVMTENGPVTATRYRYSGELETEVWYDDAGRWVKLRFKGREGTPIAYKCRRCQGGATGR